MLLLFLLFGIVFSEYNRDMCPYYYYYPIGCYWSISRYSDPDDEPYSDHSESFECIDGGDYVRQNFYGTAYCEGNASSSYDFPCDSDICNCDGDQSLSYCNMAMKAGSCDYYYENGTYDYGTEYFTAFAYGNCLPIGNVSYWVGCMRGEEDMIGPFDNRNCSGYNYGSTTSSPLTTSSSCYEMAECLAYTTTTTMEPTTSTTMEPNTTMESSTTEANVTESYPPGGVNAISIAVVIAFGAFLSLLV